MQEQNKTEKQRAGAAGEEIGTAHQSSSNGRVSNRASKKDAENEKRYREKKNERSKYERNMTAGRASSGRELLACAHKFVSDRQPMASMYMATYRTMSSPVSRLHHFVGWPRIITREERVKTSRGRDSLSLG